MNARWPFAIGSLILILPVAAGSDWPQFRGANNSGVAEESSPPAEWGMDKNVRWKVEIPGVAWSSPIVWGDKVFVTTAVTEKQTKPKPGASPMGGMGGFGGRPGGGGGFGGGGRPGFGGFMPQPGQVLSPFVQQRLNLSDEQKKKLEELQKDVDAGLAKILGEEQKKQLKDSGQGPGGGRGFGGFPQPGQVLSANLQESLKLTEGQKKQVEELQKDVDAKLGKLLTDEQSKQLKEMRQGGGFGRPGGGFGGPGGGRGGFPGGPGGMGGFGGGKPPDALYRWEVLCLDRATGRVLWKQLATEHKPTFGIHATNTYASETPVTDGERIYAYFGMTGLFCYDLSGKFLWKKEFGSYPMMFGFGPGSSPAIEGDRLFIQCDNEEKSFLLALDKKTGEQIWRVDRNARSTWTTPFVWKSKAGTEIVTCGGERVHSYDPATGKVHWELGGVQGQCAATPVATEEMLYVGAGGPMSNNPFFAVRAGSSGDLTLKQAETSNAGIAWHRTGVGLDLASPLLYQDHLYVLAQNGGIVNCLNAKTGEQAYKQRLQGAKSFTASPWASGGKVFCLDEEGTTFILAAGPQFKLLAQNKLDEMFWSTPAVAGSDLILRGVDHLYCVGK